jgi:DNA-binding CsgD family transcriptional regulator
VPRALAELRLDGVAASVYAHAVHVGRIGVADAVALDMTPDDLRAVIDRLCALCLLRPAPGTGGGFTALDPEIAAASLISPLEAEIYYRQNLITTIRAQMGPLRPRFEEGQRPARQLPSVRALDDTADMVGSLHVAFGRCQGEVVSVRSRRIKWDDSLEAELARDIATLQRGVRVRVLYQHAARADLATRSYIRRIAAAGAEIRTTDQMPRPYMVFDHGTAFISDGSGALEVSNAALAKLLGDVFDSLWRVALPYRAKEAGYQDAAAEMQKTIARLLAEGLTDEVIARQLGISPRSCRRHIAALMKHLHSVSRFQAGTVAARTGLVCDQ